MTPERLMQLGFAYAPPLIVGAAVSNKVFDSLANGPKTVEQVSSQTGSSKRGLRIVTVALDPGAANRLLIRVRACFDGAG